MGKIYIKAWFTASFANKAPFHDFEFFKELVKYQNIVKELSNAPVITIFSTLIQLLMAHLSLTVLVQLSQKGLWLKLWIDKNQLRKVLVD